MTTRVKKSEEKARIYKALLKEAIRGLQDASVGRTVSLKKLKARYAR